MAKSKSRSKIKSKAVTVILKGKAAPANGKKVNYPDSRKCRWPFNQEMADRICERMAHGETINQICRDADMPAPNTIRYAWTHASETFAEQYARAQEALYEYLAEETLDIADDGSNDWIEREIEGGRIIRVVDQEHIARSRVRIDTRRWLLSKLLPKKYGEKLDLNVAGQPNGAPLKHFVLGTTDPLEAAKVYQDFIANT